MLSTYVEGDTETVRARVTWRQARPHLHGHGLSRRSRGHGLFL